ncbi:glycosyltransferase family 2 protein [Marinirhabdus gelatinilytica]|uniref:Glycosyl transferase family 2 n=1 Tax=Marinirhabdus gelatinilytica TaxID=1703343 RepID=A0A370Q4G3_9FLAO|nr:glycosyltransferase family A protein [Marinirhabdus gelatinilytica]RDK83234.1 glycosyl transferase family 2 [Marinirhabdus gelatinilytica]
MPKFSIIIPLYNKEKDIGKTLNSLFLQTFTNFEVVIVNDGSTDNSEAVVNQFKDDRIAYFSKENEGVSKTRNVAASKASSQYIVFLDADDYWHANHLENLNKLVTKFPDNLWYATAYEKRHNHKLTTPMISPILEKGGDWMGLVHNYFENSLVDPLAWTSAVCFKKSFFEKLNGFDTAITHGAGEDTDLWLRAALEAPLAFSNTITARHNLDGSNRISHTPTLLRNFMALDRYESQTEKHPGLKRYLDLNRFSFAMQHKMAGDSETFKKFAKQITPESLTTKQRYMLKQPKQMLKLLLKGKAFAERLGIRLTSFN